MITRVGGLYSVVGIVVPPPYLSLEIGYPARRESDGRSDNDGMLPRFLFELVLAAVVGPTSRLSRC